MPVVIVNADDFGLTHGVNRAVVEAHEHGILTSTTVLVGSGAADEAGEVARRHPELGIGLHVNLTHGRPVRDPARVRTLVDGDGLLVPDLRRRALRGEVDADHVHAEVTAQVERLRALGVEPTHWDSHQGIAFWPRISRPVAAALVHAGVRRARSPRVWGEGAAARFGGSAAEAALRLGERVGGVSLRTFAMPARRTSAGLVVAADYAGAWERLFRVVPAAGITEIVCHPAVVDDEIRTLTPTLVDDRALDLAALLEPRNRRTLEERGFTFASFTACDFGGFRKVRP